MATITAPSGNGHRLPNTSLIARSTCPRHLALALGVAACGAPQPTVPASEHSTHLATEGQQAPTSEAPVTSFGVRAKLVAQQGATRTYQLVLVPGTEAVAAISDFVAQVGRKVVAQTKERVFKGNSKSSEKLVSIFETQTKILRRGKAGRPPSSDRW